MGRHKKLGRKPLPKKVLAQHKQEWRAKNTKLINIRLNVDTDKDVIEYLNKVENKTDYLRNLIREDMKN